jgi:GT2 family glycosyltransferase
MTNEPIASIIIAFYKRLDFLKIIIAGLENQSLKGFEVIVAEDDNSPLTIEYISQIENTSSYKIKLVSQEDKGFRKNKILNEAIKNASSKTILFLDGDCVPHKHFVKQYCSILSKGTVYFGRRVMLGENITAKLLQTSKVSSLTFINLLFSDSNNIEEGLYISWYKKNKNYGLWGCNWGVMKQDLLDVNGFDEDYVIASVGEDDDIEYRLKKNGVTFSSLKHKAIVYHLHHKENYNNTESYRTNNVLFDEKKKRQNPKCINGIVKLYEQ